MIPQELQERPQWVAWRYEKASKGDKPTKIPYNPVSKQKASTTAQGSWLAYPDALKASADFSGLGFVFTEDDPYCGIDLDNCRAKVTGDIDSWAQEVIDALDSYTEVSPSQTGVHIIMRGHAFDRMKADIPNISSHIEIYDQKRYFTMTGNQVPNTPDTVNADQAALNGVYARYFPQTVKSATTERKVTTEPDAALIARIQKSKQADKFTQLMNGDAASYPSPSNADEALFSILAWWTKDSEQIKRIAHTSGLVRDKWEREDYMERSIRNAIELAGEKGATAKGEGETQAQALMRLASAAKFFKTPEGDLYARVPCDGHTEIWSLDERGAFGLWLKRAYYLECQGMPNATATTQVIDQCRAAAHFSKDCEKVYVRVAHLGDVVYVDMGDDLWRTIRIDAQGWQVMPNAPVAFRRSGATMPLPMPLHGGHLDELRAFVNIGDDNQWMLYSAWLVSAFSNGPFTVLNLNGAKGSAKSSVTRYTRELLDPSSVMARSIPKEKRDLDINAKNNFVIALDNLSTMPAWFSDALCRLSTGSADAYRSLYTNDDESIFAAKRPVILNGIEEVSTRGDLLDRSLLLNLPSIERYIAETEIDAAFYAKRPCILGALFDAVSMAIRNLPSVRMDSVNRMPDFERWVVAAAPALGWRSKDFLEAYSSNRENATGIALEASPLAHAIQVFAALNGSWEGPCEKLFDKIKLYAANEDNGIDMHTLPKTAGALSQKLKRLAPDLKRVGIVITHKASKTMRSISVEKLATGDTTS